MDDAAGQAETVGGAVGGLLGVAGFTGLSVQLLLWCWSMVTGAWGWL